MCLILGVYLGGAIGNNMRGGFAPPCAPFGGKRGVNPQNLGF